MVTISGPFSYKSTDEKELEAANKLLNDQGVQLMNLKGDAACHSLLLLAGNNLLECDIVYGHFDGEGFGDVDIEAFRKMKEEDWAARLFKFAMVDKPNSPNGFLPTYR